MNDERVVEEIVTKFLLNTCRLRPRLTNAAVESALRSVACVDRLHPHLTNTAIESALRSVGMRADNPADYAEATFISLITGSVAEFYIEPMLPHIGDIDVMFYFNIDLAIPRGHSPPTQLPTEFQNCVRVFEITDSHLSGYVYT